MTDVAQLPEQAPDFTLDHIAGHSVSLSDFRGRTVVVTFGGRESAQQVREGIIGVRQRHDSDELPAIGISDVRAAPRPARVLVKSQLKKAFEEAVKEANELRASQGKPALADPAQGVVMLMDWDGKVVDSYGLKDVDKEAVAVLVDGDGRVIGSGTGSQMAEQVLAALESR